MDANWVRLAMMAIGAASLYIGYRLFCDVPQRGSQPVWGVVLRNFLAGGLLAVVGLGILFTEARAFAAQNYDTHRGWDRNRPAERGSYQGPRLHRDAVVERSA